MMKDMYESTRQEKHTPEEQGGSRGAAQPFMHANSHFCFIRSKNKHHKSYIHNITYTRGKQKKEKYIENDRFPFLLTIPQYHENKNHLFKLLSLIIFINIPYFPTPNLSLYKQQDAPQILSTNVWRVKIYLHQQAWMHLDRRLASPLALPSS